MNKDEESAEIYQSHMDAMQTQVDLGKAKKEDIGIICMEGLKVLAVC